MLTPSSPITATHIVVQVERQPERVEAGTEVGTRRRDPDVGRAAAKCRTGHVSPPARAWPAAAWASTGTVSGLGAPAIAHSGSLSPLPVTVQTTVEPAGSRPSAAVMSSPATLAAEAGSTNTASVRASSR